MSNRSLLLGSTGQNEKVTTRFGHEMVTGACMVESMPPIGNTGQIEKGSTRFGHKTVTHREASSPAFGAKDLRIAEGSPPVRHQCHVCRRAPFLRGRGRPPRGTSELEMRSSQLRGALHSSMEEFTAPRRTSQLEVSSSQLRGGLHS